MVKMFSKHVSQFMGGKFSKLLSKIMFRKFSKLVSKIMVRMFSKHVSKIIVKNFSKLVCNVKEMKIVVISLPDIMERFVWENFFLLIYISLKFAKIICTRKFLIYMFVWKGQRFHKINPDVNSF